MEYLSLKQTAEKWGITVMFFASLNWQKLQKTPDNLRTAVTRHSKDELVLQSAFSDPKLLA